MAIHCRAAKNSLRGTITISFYFLDEKYFKLILTIPHSINLPCVKEFFLKFAHLCQPLLCFLSLRIFLVILKRLSLEIDWDFCWRMLLISCWEKLALYWWFPLSWHTICKSTQPMGDEARWLPRFLLTYRKPGKSHLRSTRRQHCSQSCFALTLSIWKYLLKINSLGPVSANHFCQYTLNSSRDTVHLTILLL